MSSKEFRDFKFIDIPPKLSLKNYEQVIVELKKLSFSHNIFVIEKSRSSAIHPGITDIDLVIKTEKPSYVSQKMNDLFSHELIKDVLYHEPIILSAELFTQYTKVGSVRNAVLKNLKTDQTINCEISTTNMLVREMLDGCVHIHRGLLFQKYSKVIRCRRVLHKCLAIANLFSYTKLSTNTRMMQHNLLTECLTLRKNWFVFDENKKYTQLINLLESAILAIEKICMDVNNLLPSIPYDVYFDDPHTPMVFIQQINYDKINKWMDNSFTKSKIVCVFPSALSTLFQFYATKNGLIAHHISKYISHTLDSVDPHFLSAATDYFEFNEKQLQFSINGKIETGPLLHFHLHEHFSLKNKLKRSYKSFTYKRPILYE